MQGYCKKEHSGPSHTGNKSSPFKRMLLYGAAAFLLTTVAVPGLQAQVERYFPPDTLKEGAMIRRLYNDGKTSAIMVLEPEKRKILAKKIGQDSLDMQISMVGEFFKSYVDAAKALGYRFRPGTLIIAPETSETCNFNGALAMTWPMSNIVSIDFASALFRASEFASDEQLPKLFSLAMCHEFCHWVSNLTIDENKDVYWIHSPRLVEGVTQIMATDIGLEMFRRGDMKAFSSLDSLRAESVNFQMGITSYASILSYAMGGKDILLKNFCAGQINFRPICEKYGISKDSMSNMEGGNRFGAGQNITRFIFANEELCNLDKFIKTKNFYGIPQYVYWVLDSLPVKAVSPNDASRLSKNLRLKLAAYKNLVLKKGPDEPEVQKSFREFLDAALQLGYLICGKAGILPTNFEERSTFLDYFVSTLASVLSYGEEFGVDMSFPNALQDWRQSITAIADEYGLSYSDKIGFYFKE